VTQSVKLLFEANEGKSAFMRQSQPNDTRLRGRLHYHGDRHLRRGGAGH
jgi:hypothetical protein